jgi:transposase
MPKKAHLENHLSSNELKSRYLKSQDSVEARRWHLIWKVSLGWSIKNSAVAIGINYDYSQEIIKRYNRSGEEGIKNLKKISQTRKGGKKQILNEQQIEKLKQEIEKRPSDGGIWTGAKVARWIEEETGIEKVWNQRGWDYLKKCDYSWHRPRQKHRKEDEIEQAEFIEKFPDKVRKLADKYPEEQIDVW